MFSYHKTGIFSWQQAIVELLPTFTIYAPIKNPYGQDYELVHPSNVKEIIYNLPRPVSPLKVLFLPVKQNVVIDDISLKPRIILGTPACDLAALDLLDAMYLDEQFVDDKYKKNRENTFIIGTDCFEFLEDCHCTTFSINPYPERNCDIILSVLNDSVYLQTLSQKGKKLLAELSRVCTFEEVQDSKIEVLKLKRLYIKDELTKRNGQIPSGIISNRLVKAAEGWYWKRKAVTCVSCGACATICPTCTCFLLIDRPEFEKVRQTDACQYPGFERVAAGEDPLRELNTRFRNRYLCKFAWKPDRFNIQACTGCGRCISACIGKINKNTVLAEIGIERRNLNS